MKKSIGLLEVKGLASAIRVADTMAKNASVEMLGIENAKGGGWMTIKISGDVAAVQSSVSSGSALAKQLGCHVAEAVLSRPDQQLIGHLIKTASTGKSKTIDKSANADDTETAKKKVKIERTKEKTNQAKESKEQSGENMMLTEEVVKSAEKSSKQTG